MGMFGETRTALSDLPQTLRAANESLSDASSEVKAAAVLGGIAFAAVAVVAVVALLVAVTRR
jgi:hypothetical protein